MNKKELTNLMNEIRIRHNIQDIQDYMPHTITTHHSIIQKIHQANTKQIAKIKTSHPQEINLFLEYKRIGKEKFDKETTKKEEKLRKIATNKKKIK